jgi:hypothetical protein
MSVILPGRSLHGLSDIFCGIRIPPDIQRNDCPEYCEPRDICGINTSIGLIPDDPALHRKLSFNQAPPELPGGVRARTPWKPFE